MKNVDEGIISRNYMKMSRRPTFYETFSILDDHCNSNLRWVEVNGRCNYFVDASYPH